MRRPRLLVLLALSLVLPLALTVSRSNGMARVDDPPTPPTAPSTPPPQAPASPPISPPASPPVSSPVAPPSGPVLPEFTPPPQGTEITREQLPAAPLVNGKKKRVHIIEDRFSEWGGTVEAESDDYIVIDTKGKLKGFYKARISEIVLLVEPEPNQPGVVLMRDGMKYKGIILADNFDSVEIQVEGIKQKLPREAVLRTTLTLTPRQTYEKLRKAIQPDQYSERMTLCRYLFEKKMYKECREELISLLEAAEIYEAKELLRTVEAQLALEKSETPASDPALSPDSPLDENTADDNSPLSSQWTAPTRILSPEDVNIIRVYEVDFRKPPKLMVPPETIRAMIEKYSASSLIPSSSEGRAALFREDPVKLLRLLFDLKARELYGKVEVLGEPWALNLFRLKVHNTWLINNCATSQCHGGVDAGRFFLHRKLAQTAQVRYTNLLLLERTKLPERPPLIDWQKPRDSLVVQFGLPRSEARYPHPDVKGWKPVFNSSNRKLIDDFERWVLGMYQPRPDYPVDLTPPDLSAPDLATPVDAPRVPR